MALYTVTIRTLSTGTTRTTKMRSPDSETPAELYSRAVAKLYPGCRFHGDLPEYPHIGCLAWSSRQPGVTNLGARVRIDTERC